MRCRTRCLRTTTLVDRDIDKHAPRLHTPQHLPRDQPRRARARHQHRADQKIHLRQHFLQVRLVRVKRMRGVQRDIQETHPLEINFQNGHIRPQPLRHARGIDSRRPSADHHHFPRQHPGYAAEQHAIAAMVLGQTVGSHHHRHPAGNLAHRLEQRQASIDLDRLVSQPRHPALHQ